MTFDDIAADVLPLLPGIPQPRAERALLRCAQQLCRTARIWREWTEAVQVQGDGEHDVELPTGAQVDVVEAMTVDGHIRPMLPWGFVPGAPDEVRGGAVVPGRLVFHVGAGVPKGAQVRFRVSLLPSEDAATLPDEVFRPHAMLLAEGVIGQCMADVGRPWSSGDAGAHMAMFEHGASRAGVREWRSNTDITPRQRVQWC